MNLIFMRHGEATNNVNKIISDKEIYFSILTENGINDVLESLAFLPNKIDKVYVSPFPRTIETANYVCEKYSNLDIIIENRLREIYHGKYSGKKNNTSLDSVRLKQIDGDYFVRFGEYGENKYDIESRLCDFLFDVYNNNFKENTILIISHGSIISYIKRLLGIKSPHIKTGKLEEFLDVSFKPLFDYKRKMESIKANEINKRIKQIRNLTISDNLRNSLFKMIKKEFNNVEFPNSYLDNFIAGINTNCLIQKNDIKFDNNIVLICFYNNFENLANKWINHYIDIGIKNFVLVDNNSSDNSFKLLKKYEDKVNISFWKINEKYNCYKMCGWKMQILEHYGINRRYLIVDADELFIYKDYKNITLDEFIKNKNISFIKSMMLDVYTDKEIYKGKLDDFKYIDSATYKISCKTSYGKRFYGGPRSRIFGISPSLQKIPFITYSGNELYVNDHYYYPFDINNKAKYCSYLLHYKFLKEDRKKYEEFVNDKRHWNNSHEYKVYKNVLRDKNITFYDKKISILLTDINFDF